MPTTAYRYPASGYGSIRDAQRNQARQRQKQQEFRALTDPDPLRRQNSANMLGVKLPEEGAAVQYQRDEQRALQDEVRSYAKSETEAARTLKAQQKEAASQQKAQAKEQFNAEKNRREAAFIAEKRPMYTDADGMIQPKHSDEEWRGVKQSEAAATKATEDLATQKRGIDATEKAISEVDSQFTLRGRELRAAAAAMRREAARAKSDADPNADTLKAESRAAQRAADEASFQELEWERNKLKNKAVATGAQTLNTAAKAQVKDLREGRLPADTNLVQTPEQPAPLPDVPGTADTVNERMIGVDGQPVAPPKPGMGDLRMAEAAEAPARVPTLDEQIQTHQAEVERFNATQQAATKPLDDVVMKIQARGIAEPLVQLPDGTTGFAPGVTDEEKQMIRLANQAVQKHAPTLEARAREIDARATQLQAEQQAETQKQKAEMDAQMQRMRATPGMAQAADQIAKLDADFESVVSKLDPQNSEEDKVALQAIQERYEQERTAAIRGGESERERIMTALNAERQRIKGETAQEISDLASGPDYGSMSADDSAQDFYKEAGERSFRAQVEAGVKLGLDPETSAAMVQDLAALNDDWKGVEGVKPADQARVLSNGAVVVNPSLYIEPEKFKQAVESAPVSDEAKADALERLPELEEAALTGLLNNLKGAPGFLDFAKKNNAGIFVPGYANLSTYTPEELAAEKAASKFATGADLVRAYRSGPGSNWFRNQAHQALTGLFSGTMGMAQQATGTYGAVTGNEDAISLALDAGKVMQQAGAQSRAMQNGQWTHKITQGGTSILPALLGGVIVPRAIAMYGTAAAAGTQSFGGTFSDAVQANMDSGMDMETARKASLGPAIASGLTTAALTYSFGATGVEAMFAQNQFKETGKAFLKTIAKQSGIEFTEEGADQFMQGVIAGLSYNPGKPFKQIIEEAWEAAVIGGILGGGMSSVTNADRPMRAQVEQNATGDVTGDSMQGLPADVPLPADLADPPRVTTLQETANIAGSDAEIARLQQTDPALAARAEAIRQIASGTTLDQMTDAQLASVGVERNAKGEVVNVKPKQGEPAPAVKIENGQPIITQPALDALEQTAPRTRALVQMDETTARQRISQKQTESLSPSDASTGAEVTGKPRGSSTQAVAVPADSGAEVVAEGAAEASLADAAPATRGATFEDIEAIVADRMGSAWMASARKKEPARLMSNLRIFFPEVSEEYLRAFADEFVNRASAPVEAAPAIPRGATIEYEGRQYRRRGNGEWTITDDLNTLPPIITSAELDAIYQQQEGAATVSQPEQPGADAAVAPPSPATEAPSVPPARAIMDLARPLVQAATASGNTKVASRLAGSAKLLSGAITQVAKDFAGVRYVTAAPGQGPAALAPDGALEIDVASIMRTMGTKSVKDSRAWLESVIDEEFKHRVALDLEMSSPEFANNLSDLYYSLPNGVKEMSRAAYFAQVDAPGQKNEFSNDRQAAHEFFRQYWQSANLQKATESALTQKGLIGKLRSLIASFLKELRRIQKGANPQVKAVADRLIAQAEAKAKELKGAATSQQSLQVQPTAKPNDAPSTPQEGSPPQQPTVQTAEKPDEAVGEVQQPVRAADPARERREGADRGEQLAGPKRKGKPAKAAIVPASTRTQKPEVAAERVAEQVERLIDTEGVKSAADIQRRIIAALEEELKVAEQAVGFKTIDYNVRPKVYGDVVAVDKLEPVATLNKFDDVAWFGDWKERMKGVVIKPQQNRSSVTPTEWQRSVRLAIANAIGKQKKLGNLRLQIPGDGTFTIARNPVAISETMARIQRGGPSMWTDVLKRSKQKPRPSATPRAESEAGEGLSAPPTPKDESARLTELTQFLRSLYDPRMGDSAIDGEMEYATKTLKRLSKSDVDFEKAKQSLVLIEAGKGTDTPLIWLGLKAPPRSGREWMADARTSRTEIDRDDYLSELDQTVRNHPKNQSTLSAPPPSEPYTGPYADIINAMSAHLADYTPTAEELAALEEFMAMDGPATVQPPPLAPTSEPKVEPRKTSIKNAVVNEERAARGLNPLPEPSRRGWDTVTEAADAQLKADPTAGQTLLEELKQRPRPITDQENALLLLHKVITMNRWKAAAAEVNNSEPDSEENKQAKARYDALADRYNEIDLYGKKAGTELGRGLNARKMLRDTEVSEEWLMQRWRTEVNLGKPLSEKQKATVKKGAARVKRAQRVDDELTEEAQAKLAERALQRLAADMAKAGSSKREGVRAFVKNKAKSARERIKAAMGLSAPPTGNLSAPAPSQIPDADLATVGAELIADGITSASAFAEAIQKELGITLGTDASRVFLASKRQYDRDVAEFERANQPKALIAAAKESDGEIDLSLLTKLAKSYIRQGVKDAEELTAKIAADLQALQPGITQSEVNRLLSGYGKTSQSSKDEVQRQLTEIKSQLRLLSGIEDVGEGKPPLKSGFQRGKPSPRVRELATTLRDKMREAGIETSGEEQLASARKAVVNRLNNQIADLNAIIAGKGKRRSDQTAIEYDAEMNALLKERNELKEYVDDLTGPNAELQWNRRAQAAAKASEEYYKRRIATADFESRKLPGQTENADTRKARAEAKKAKAEFDRMRDATGIPQAEQLASVKAQLEKEIEKVRQRLITGQKPETPASQKPSDSETAALRETLARLRESVKLVEGTKEQTEEQRATAAARAVQKSIDRLEQRIANKDTAPAAKRTPADSEELRALREQKAFLQEQYDALKEAQNPRRLPEEIALSNFRRHLERKRQELQNGQKAEKYLELTAPDPLFQSRRDRARFELSESKREMNTMLLDAKLAARTPFKRVLGALGEVLNVSRSILTSLDLSAVIRQGGFIGFGHPVIAAKSFGPMLRAFYSRENEFKAMEEIKARKNFPLYKQSKLYMTDMDEMDLAKMEENYMSRLATKIPLVAGSQRAYITFLNKLRADTFDLLIETLGRDGRVTEAEGKALASFINVATGRGIIGPADKPQGTPVLSTIFFSPRLMASRFNLLFGQPIYGGNARTRVLVAQQYGRFLVGIGASLALLALFKDPDDDEPMLELDPRSADFLKAKFGNTRLDIFGGLLQATVLMSRVVSGKVKKRGKLVDIRGPNKPYSGDSTVDILAKFIRSKLSPAIGTAVNLGQGQDFAGEPVTPVGEAIKMTVPMSLTNIKDVMEDQGVPRGTAMTLLSLFGAGLQTYDGGSAILVDPPALEELVKNWNSALPEKHDDRWTPGNLTSADYVAKTQDPQTGKAVETKLEDPTQKKAFDAMLQSVRAEQFKAKVPEGQVKKPTAQAIKTVQDIRRDTKKQVQVAMGKPDWPQRVIEAVGKDDVKAAQKWQRKLQGVTVPQTAQSPAPSPASSASWSENPMERLKAMQRERALR